MSYDGIIIAVYPGESHADALRRTVDEDVLQFPVTVCGHEFYNVFMRSHDHDAPIRFACIEDVPLDDVRFAKTGDYVIRYVKSELN